MSGSNGVSWRSVLGVSEVSKSFLGSASRVFWARLDGIFGGVLGLSQGYLMSVFRMFFWLSGVLFGVSHGCL